MIIVRESIEEWFTGLLISIRTDRLHFFWLWKLNRVKYHSNGPMKLLVVLPNQSDCVLFQSFNQWNCFIYRSTRVVSVCFKPQTKHFDQPCCGVVPILLERWSILCRTKTMKNNKKMWSLWTDLLMEERRRLFTDLTQLLALKYDDTSQQIKEKTRTWTGQMPFSWEDGSAESECSWIITYNTCWG